MPRAASGGVPLKDHPTVEDFEGFLRRASGPGTATRNAQILRHLLAECASCRDLLQAMGWGEHRLSNLLSFPVDREDDRTAAMAAHYDYSRAFAAAEQSLRAFCAEGKAGQWSPEELLAELAPLPSDEQERLVKADRRFADPRLVQRLVEMSKALRYENAARRLHLAKLAVLAAEACIPAVAVAVFYPGGII